MLPKIVMRKKSTVSVVKSECSFSLFLTDAKINSIEHADFDGVERLALVTGGDVVSR